MIRENIRKNNTRFTCFGGKFRYNEEDNWKNYNY